MPPWGHKKTGIATVALAAVTWSVLPLAYWAARVVPTWMQEAGARGVPSVDAKRKARNAELVLENVYQAMGLFRWREGDACGLNTVSAQAPVPLLPGKKSFGDYVR